MPKSKHLLEKKSTRKEESRGSNLDRQDEDYNDFQQNLYSTSLFQERGYGLSLKPSMMANNTSRNQPRGEEWSSQLFLKFGKYNAPDFMRQLDREAHNYETTQREILDDRDGHIHDLLEKLEDTQVKLKRLQESRFKSRERDLAVADSTLIQKYKEIIGDIKQLVLGLTKSMDPNAHTLLNLMSKSSRYQEGLQKLLQPNVTVQQFVSMLETSKSPPKVLGFILRGIILDMLATHLFNKNVFLCLGGENWNHLKGVYLQLLSKTPGTSQDLTSDAVDDFDIPTDGALRRDASLWRSQTILTLDRSSERLGLKEGREMILKRLVGDIEELLNPLSTSRKEIRESVRNEISFLVESAANFSIVLGKMRAMFELNSKRTLGTRFASHDMEAVGPHSEDVTDEDADDKDSNHHEFEVVAVVTPALLKHGNDDGEYFDSYQVSVPAQVLVMPSSNFSNKPAASLQSAPATTPAQTNDTTSNGRDGPGSPTIRRVPASIGQDGQPSEPVPVPPPKDDEASASGQKISENDTPPEPPAKDDARKSKELKPNEKELVAGPPEPKVRPQDLSRSDGDSKGSKSGKRKANS